MQIKDEKLYYVGGVVRDEILGLQSFDIDYCYEGDAIKFAENLNVVKTNPDFGTVRIIDDGKEIDIASTRTECYPKLGHLPQIKQLGCSLEKDLKRRDFTINALAKNTITGKVIDYFNGLDDIKNKKIRVLHDKSFIEDPSRIIRGLKFCVRFGFELDEHTKNLQNDYLKNINYDLSYHRLKKELKETFNLNKYDAYEKFIESNIYRLLGENQIAKSINKNIEKLIEKYSIQHIWLVYLGAYDLSKFELTSEENEIIRAYQQIKEENPKTDYEIYKTFEKKPFESLLIYAAFNKENVVVKFLDTLQYIKIEINGNDLQQIGLIQGRIYSDIFDYVLKKKLLSPNMTKLEEIQIVKEKFCV